MGKNRVAVAIVLLFSSLVVQAESTLKLGFVDIPYLIDKAPTAVEAALRLEKEFAPRQLLLQKQQKSLDEKRYLLEKEGLVISIPKRRLLEKEIRRLKRKKDRNEQDFREDLNIQKNNEFKKVRRSVMEAIAQLAKDEQYDLILSDGVLFASKRTDLTQKLLNLLKSQLLLHSVPE
ncbi:MAG: OmpH family outer membrane protein [Gammaproteobacteria bacterium]|nr:OmpH family outer membrane protein [Gammaproteobacteria bacterium]